MPFPYIPLWQEIYETKPSRLLLYHPQPQIWASYLSLSSLVLLGGIHLVIVQGYEKEAFYRSAFKWLSLVGVENYLTKNGIDLGHWGRLYFIYPVQSKFLIQEARSCTVASPYAFKRDYYHFLISTLPENSHLWTFLSLASHKKENSLLNQRKHQFSWHHELPNAVILNRPNKSFDNWVFCDIWERFSRRESLILYNRNS